MADRVGQQLGNYRLIRLLGRGGFAEVYLGEHIRLKTNAAIKVLYTQLAEGNEAEGFLKEAQTIAHLLHPHIVRIFDYDVQEGVPFLVMDYAPNGNLRQRHPKGTLLPLDTIIGYIRQVSDALQYAHDEKLIHRDIKPENMLLGRNNEILLSDFGIALIAQSTRMQSTQEVVGTAYYMAPEQLQGKPRLASDQYALGIVVYEWLTGDRPFHGSFSEIASQHMFVPPAPLREKVASISPAVEEVVLTALKKDPHKRFGSVRAFATALEQASQPAAKLDTPSQPLREYGPQPLLPPFGQPPVQSRTITPPGHLPVQSGTITPPGQLARQTDKPLERSESIHQSGQIFTPPVTPLVSNVPQPSRRGLSRRTFVIGAITAAGVLATGAGILWFTHRTPPIGTTLYTYRGHSSYIWGVAWSPDGQRIASASSDKTVQVWDATTGNNPFTYQGHGNIVFGVAWSPNGQRIASASWDNTVQVWDTTPGHNLFIYQGHKSLIYGVAWSPNGQRIASAGDDGVQVWDATTGNNSFTYQRNSSAIYGVAWSPDGQHIASASADGTVQVWNATNGNDPFTYRGHIKIVFGVAWSPDGQRIASASYDRTVQVWDATNGSNPFTYQGHSNAVGGVAWSPNGQRIASASYDGTVQIWDANNGGNVYTYQGHSGPVNAVAWSPNGQYIASASDDMTVQVWQAV